MVREFETEHMRGFIDVVSVHQEILALLDHERMDVADGGAAGGLVDDIPQITGRIGQFFGAVPDGGDAQVQLPALQIIVPEQLMEALEQVR